MTDISTALAPVTHDGQPMIDARGLHEWLGNKTPYNDWMRRRIAEYGFQPDTDFHAIVRKTGGRPKVDHFLTVGMAKELAMVERSKIGQLTRRRDTKCDRNTPDREPLETVGFRSVKSIWANYCSPLKKEPFQPL